MGIVAGKKKEENFDKELVFFCRWQYFKVKEVSGGEL